MQKIKQSNNKSNNKPNMLEENKYSNSNNNMGQIELSDLQNNTVLPPQSNIKKEDTIIFSNINIDNLDYSNERANGIKSLAYEIQKSSRTNGYKYYPISYCFLLRALFEQTSIYFLINMDKWEKLLTGRNRDLNLGEIITYISRNIDNLFSDNINIKRSWNIVFGSDTTKDYLDLVIHHPYKIYPNIEYIKTISDIGLFSIIQYFINKKVDNE